MKKLFLLFILFASDIGFIHAQWLQTNGPFGGLPVSCLTFIGNKILAGTGDGIFISSDTGASWQSGNVGLTSFDVRSLDVKGSSVFAGTSGGGVFMSSDSGSSWMVDTLGMGNAGIYALASNDSSVFAGGSGVYLLTHNSTNWTLDTFGLGNAFILALAAKGSNILAGGPFDPLYRSVDNGINWTSAGLSGVTALTISGNKIFAGTWSGIYISDDSGSTWSPDTAGFGNLPVLSLASSGNMVFAGTNGSGVFISTDSGATWTQSALKNWAVYGLAASENIICAGTSAGNSGGTVIMSNDTGTTWATTGIEVNSDISALVASGGNVFAGSYFGSIASTANSGLTWSVIQGSSQYGSIKSLVVNGNRIFAGFDGGLYVSNNNCQSWTNLSAGLPNQPVISIGVNDTNIFVVDSGMVYLSTNNGANWTNVLSLFLNPVLSVSVEDTTIFAGTQYGIYVSHNNGAFWGGPYVFNEQVISWAYLGNKIIAGDRGQPFASGGLIVSNDHGMTWNPLTNALSGFTVYSFAVAGDTVFAGTNDGIFFSTDSCVTWTQANTGLTDTIIKSLVIEGGNVFAGTSADNPGYAAAGVWKRPLTDFGIISAMIDPAGYPLPELMVYPNPSNGILNLIIPENTKMNSTILVTDVWGNSVWKSIAGNSDYIKIDLSSKANGFYLVHVISSSVILKQKIIVCR